MQSHLFNIGPNPKDVVFTPDDVARDVVNFYKPTGRILEPSKGDGAFMRHLPPDTEWCEITEGRDFFQWQKRVDWIIGNPPYSIFADWLRHSFTVADDIVYLVPIIRCWVSSRIIKDIKAYGGIMCIYVVEESAFTGWSINFAIGAIHFQRGYTGGISTHFRRPPNNPMQATFLRSASESA